MANADCVLIEGGNMAEAHPVGFRWVMKAKERGATIIHVDPRYSRTSALADQHVPIRAGTDIAFQGGLIRHVIETESYFKDYVCAYTNAAALVNEKFQDTDHVGNRVNRTLGFAHLGGATLDNEENYLIKKFFSAMGAVQIENQARI